MSQGGGPHGAPLLEGLKVEFKNLVVSVVGEVVSLTIDTPIATVGAQYSLETGSLIGGSSAPKT